MERYLADELVAAHRESLAARSWRWVRRHRSFVTSASVVALLAIAGLTVGVGLLKVQRDRAERNFQLAQDAVRQYYIRVSEETLLNQPGMQPLRDALLKQSLEYYQEFLEERGDDPQLRQEVAQAEFFVGRMIETIDAAKPAIEHYERAAEVQQQLVAKSSGNARTELEVEYAQTLNALGRAHQNLKQNKSARQYFTAAAELREAIAKQRPDDAEAARTLASSLMNLGLLDLAAGDSQAAIKQLERAQTLRRTQLNGDKTPQTLRRDLGMGDFNLAQVRIQQGDLPGAKQNLAEAIATFGSLATANPGDFENSRRLALCQRMLGDVEAASGRPEEAVAALSAARTAMRELADRNPSVPEYAADLAGIEMNLGMQFSADGETSGALESLESATKRLQTLQAAGDASPRHQCDLGVALRATGELLADVYRLDDARAKLQESQRILRELVEQHPNEPQFAAELKLTDELLAELDAI